MGELGISGARLCQNSSDYWLARLYIWTADTCSQVNLQGVIVIVTQCAHDLYIKARFPFKRNRLRCVRCVNKNRKKRKLLRWQAANHGCHCFDRAFLLAGAWVCCVKFSTWTTWRVKVDSDNGCTVLLLPKSRQSVQQFDGIYIKIVRSYNDLPGVRGGGWTVDRLRLIRSRIRWRQQLLRVGL